MNRFAKFNADRLKVCSSPYAQALLASQAVSPSEPGRQFTEGGCRQRLGGRVARCLLVAALLLGGMTARAANYVIMAQSGSTWHFYAYSSTQTTNYYYATDVTTFTYNLCVWSGSSGNKFRSVSDINSSYGLYYRNNNYLRNTTSPDNFTINGNRIYSSNYYICFHNNYWYTAQTSNQHYTNGVYNVLYSISGPQTASWTTPVSISGSQSTFTNLGRFTYSADAAYRLAYYTLTGNGTYYVVEGGTPSSTAPAGSNSGITYTWTLNDGTNDDGHVRINASTGEVTYYDSYASNTNTTIKVTATHTASGATSTDTKTITFNAIPIADPTGITATDKTIGQGDVWSADNYTFVIADGYSPYRYVTATSANTTIATVNNTSGTFTVTGLEMGSTTITITAYKQGNSVVAATTTFTLTVAEPQSGVSGGKVILNDYEDHSWSYYSDPDCPIRSLNPADVKITYYGDGIVMTGNADYTASTASSGYVVPGNANYGGGAKVNVGGENENTFIYYKTLERGDATQTAWTFSSGSQSSAASRCPYTTIYNPFQVRPTYGTRGSTDANDFTGWRGFQCWRLKRVSGGAVYSAASGGSALSVGAVINAETEIYFAPNNEYGMEVDFEAVWARAYLIKGNQSGANSVLSQDVGVERNFMTLTSGETYKFNGTSGRLINNLTYPVTISCYYPSGEAPANTASTVRGNDNNITLLADTKFENVGFYSMSSYTITADGHSLIVGRGCSGGSTVKVVRGISGDATSPNYTIRLESGTYNYVSFLKGYMTGSSAYSDNGNSVSGTVDLKGVFGCDYDRAKYTNGITDNLTITNNVIMGYSNTVNNTNKQRNTLNVAVKSGRIGTSVSITSNSSYIADAYQSMYLSVAGSHTYVGRRCLNVEGGELIGIAGGIDAYYLGTGTDNNNNVTGITRIETPSFEVRMTGGHVRGAIYGGAAKSPGSGNRRMIFTGGEINGWIGCGCNGTDNQGGKTYGASSLYFGGNAQCTHNTSADYEMNGSKGGNVFGAGKGYASTTGTSGEMTYGTTVVISDNAEISRDVYGGGNYGYALESTKLYISGNCSIGGNTFGGSNLKNGPTIDIEKKGGTLEGGLFGGSNANGTVTSVVMALSGDGIVKGGVYGGGYGTNSVSCDVTGTVGITMTGGTVLSGLYGGGNVNSTIGSTVTMQVNGGQVGTPESNANIHGGGYGSLTAVTGNVTVTLGASTSATDSATVNGNVFGGSALGRTNTGNTSNTTTVTMNKALVNGNIFGGALGNGAVVNGKITVNVNGGRVNGSVFGGGDAASYSPSSNHPIVNMTGGQATHVFGGGKGSTAAVTGNPQVTLSGTAHVTGNVYGGGDAAAVSGQTNVILRD